jgi:hypothetical protein
MGGMEKDVHTWYVILMEDGWRNHILCCIIIVLNVEDRVGYVM